MWMSWVAVSVVDLGGFVCGEVCGVGRVAVYLS